VVDLLGRPAAAGYASYGGTDATLSGVLRVLRRRLSIVLIPVILVPAAAAAFSLSQEDQFQAKATLLFRDSALEEPLFDTTFFPQPEDPARAAATNESLVSLGEVEERTAAQLPPRLRGAEKNVEVAGEGEADLVSITATSTDPAVAALVANTWARAYIDFRREADRETISRAKVLVERQLAALPPEEQATPRANALSERAADLETLAAVQTGNAELAERARAPELRSSPKPRRDIMLGLLLGIVLGVALAFLFERLDRRLKDPDEIEALFGWPVLGRIPSSRVVAGGIIQGAASGASRESEAFRLLRANLRYFHVDDRVRSLLITSASSGEGKTTVSWNLAAASSATGERVLVIEADLRRPALGRSVSLSGGQGLSLVLAGVARPEEVTISVGVPDSPQEAAFDVMPAGPLPPNPTELLESHRMESVLRWAEEHYDLVVVDSSPLLLVADAIPLTREVSGVLVVSRIGKSDRRASGELRDELVNLGAPVLGLVLNAHPLKQGYGYGYYQQGKATQPA
jgi:capsular exopolysaccharide synthesis family protein